MKIVSFNVNGLRAILKKDFIRDFLLLDADIFSINETKLSEVKDSFCYEPDGYNIYYTNSKVRKGYSGVCIYTKKKPLNVWYGLKDGKYDDEGRVITLEYDQFYYVACYVPNSGDGLKRLEFRMNFECDMLEYLKYLDSKKPVIYAGDLNVAHQEIDIKNPKNNEHNAGFTIEERTAFTRLLSNGFVDIYRHFNPNTVKYSWWSYRFNSRGNNAGWRIDYFILSSSIVDKVISTDILNDIYGSDHCPIILDINI